MNVTACPDAPCTAGAAKLTIPAYAYINYMYIASANLCGMERNSNFIGGSSVVGPGKSGDGAHTYVGRTFGEEGSTESRLIMGTIDLALADLYAQIPVFRNNPVIDDMDWRAELYSGLYLEAKKKNH